MVDFTDELNDVGRLLQNLRIPFVTACGELWVVHTRIRLEGFGDREPNGLVLPEHCGHYCVLEFNDLSIAIVHGMRRSDDCVLFDADGFPECSAWFRTHAYTYVVEMTDNSLRILPGPLNDWTTPLFGPSTPEYCQQWREAYLRDLRAIRCNPFNPPTCDDEAIVIGAEGGEESQETDIPGGTGERRRKRDR